MDIDKLQRRALSVAAAVAVAALAAACDRRTDVPPGPSTPSPSADLIGTPPAPPTGDPPGTTPVAANTTEVTKKEETEQKPAEGDNHSYSTTVERSPQKSGGKDGQQTDEKRKNP